MRKIETYVTGYKDIILELLYYKKDMVEVWVTRRDYGVKYLMWGFLYKYKKTKEEIIEVSMTNLLNNYKFWEEELEL